MKYRGMECAVIQDVDRGTWSWTVNLINETEFGPAQYARRCIDRYRADHRSMDCTKGLALTVHPFRSAPRLRGRGKRRN